MKEQSYTQNVKDVQKNSIDPRTGTIPSTNGVSETDEDPGKTLGVVGLVLACAGWIFGPLTAIPALAVSLVALSKSKKAGKKNGPAIAALIVSALITVFFLVIIFLIGRSDVLQDQYEENQRENTQQTNSLR